MRSETLLHCSRLYDFQEPYSTQHCIIMKSADSGGRAPLGLSYSAATYQPCVVERISLCLSFSSLKWRKQMCMPQKGLEKKKLNEIMHVKHFAQCLAQSKESANVRYFSVVQGCVSTAPGHQGDNSKDTFWVTGPFGVKNIIK